MAWRVAVVVVTWDIHPRNPNLTRTFDPLSRWTELTLVERYNSPDTWVVKGPRDALEPFTTPGAGCILDRDGVQVTSGQAGNPRRYVEDGREFLEVGFTSDLDELAGRVVLPLPSKVLTSTPTEIGADQDARTGSREALILAYVNAHLAAGATVGRRFTNLHLPASLNRGGTTNVESRLDHLGVLVQGLAEAGRLRVTVEHDESTGTPRLALRITAVPDVSANIRFGPADTTATGLLASYSVDWEKPSCTRAIVVAGGEKEARQALMLVNADAEAMWGTPQRPFIREQVIDQRQTVDPVVMTDAAQRALDEGAGFVNIELEVMDGPDVKARTDYGVGYKVGTDLPGLPDALADNIVREMTTVVKSSPGEPTEKVTIRVGSPDAATQTKNARQTTQLQRRVTTLERSA